MNKRNPLEDRLFKQFHDTKADVSQDVWKNIEAQLDAKQETKRPFPTLYFLTILAVSILGTLAVFNAHYTAVGQRSNNVMSNTPSPAEKSHDKVYTDQKDLARIPSDQKDPDVPVIRNTKESFAHAEKDTRYTGRQDHYKQTLALRTSETKETEQIINHEHNDPAGNIQEHTAPLVQTVVQSANTYQDLPQIAQPGIDLLPGSASVSISLPAPVLYKDKTNAFFFQMSAGAGLPFRSLRYTPAENRAYSARQSTEKPLYAWNINAGLGFLLDNRWSVSSGFEYFTLEEQFDYYKENAGRLEYQYDANGQLIDTQLVKGAMIERSGNSYQLINIPFSFGYETRAGKWKLGIEAGLALNVNLSVSGKILANDQQIRRLENAEDIYLPQTGISWRVGLQCFRNVDRSTAVFIRPQYQHYPERWTQSGHPADIRYSFLQCNVGMRKVF